MMPAAAIEQTWLKGAAGPLDMRFTTPARAKADVLFVHGAWASSWYWEPSFLSFFAERGYRAAAISLRGHGRSGGRLRWASIRDYVADVRAAAQSLDDPVIIGHSMGGFVAQKYARLHGARGLGLLASVPPQGAWHGFFQVLRYQPVTLLKTLASLDLFPVIADRDHARRFLLSREPDDRALDPLLDNLQSESFRAFLDMLFAPVLGGIPDTMPRIVIGGQNDRVISNRNTAATARRHGTRPIIVPGMSHMLPIDDGWKDVATALLNWLDQIAAPHEKEAIHGT